MHNNFMTRSLGWIAFAAATFMIIVLGAQSYLVSIYMEETSGWGQQFLRNLCGWYLWALFFPLIFRLAKHFPFTRGIKLRSSLVHLFAGLGFAVLHAALQILLNDWIFAPEQSWDAMKSVVHASFASTLLWRFFVYQALVTVCIALDSYRRARETEIHASQIEAGIVQAEIDSLNMRLDPEFLFKTLRQLSNLMRASLDEADSMIARLGDYLRMRLDHSGNPETTLREEIDALKLYLEIESIPSHGEVSVAFDLEPGTLDCYVPGMILQTPLVDAISKKTGKQPLHFKLSSCKTDSALILRIEDSSSREDLCPGSRLQELLLRMKELYKSPFNLRSSQTFLAIEIPLVLERNHPGEMNQIDESYWTDEPAEVSSNPVHKWLLITGIFTLLAAYFTTQRAVIHFSRGTTMDWPQQLLDCTGWYIWALITPVILKLSAMFPLQRGRWLKHGAIHCAGFLLAWAGATLVFAGVRWWANFGLVDFSSIARSTLARSPLSLDIVCYSTIVAIESAIRHHRRFELGKIRTIRLTSQLTRARLEALRMQLHPHFLFNALNSLSELMQEDVLAAEEMIGNLERFLQITMRHDHIQEIAFEQELEFLKCYLAIENIRYPNRLHVTMEIEPQTMKVPVPNLVLQPIVENAIRHGIAPRTSPGQIEIQAKRINGTLKLSVRDNGPGLKKKVIPLRSGLGLSNTRERLMQLYGADHRFELINVPEGGLLVTLEIPAERGMR